MPERTPGFVSGVGSEEGVATASERHMAEQSQEATVSERRGSPVTILQERVTELDGENLPSDVVGNPVVPRSGAYAWIVAVIHSLDGNGGI